MMHRSTTGSRGMEKQGKGQAEPARIARARARKPTEAEEMAALCAELDRRKAVIEARQVAAELEDE